MDLRAASGEAVVILGSAFSGIGGIDLAFQRAEWKIAWQIENAPFPVHILEHRFPEVKRYGDIKTVQPEELEQVDCLAGGFPCQGLSIAGRRKGLRDDPRSALFFEFVRLAKTLRPKYLLIENVPGLLSSNQGRDFAVVLHALEELGYGWSYRILDAQYVGVPQRRRRVFIVGHLGSRCPPEILFEPEGGNGDLEAGEEAGAGTPGRIAPSLVASGAGTSRPGGQGAEPGYYIPVVSGPLRSNPRNNSNPTTEARQLKVIAHAVTTREGQRQDPNGETYIVAHTLRAEGSDVGEDGTGRGVPITIAPTPETLIYQGIIFRVHASSPERDTASFLCLLREEIGEEAFTEWRSGILDSLRPKEILQPGLHGRRLRRQTHESERWMDDGALSRQKDGSARTLYEMREAGCERRSPQGWRLPQQHIGEFDKALSELSHEGAQPAWLLYGLWREGEGPRVLQPALSSVQGGAFEGGVRRLTPREAERLQGFPDDWTLPTGKESDSPRYRALGNAVAVPVVEWIARRIPQ